MALTSWQHLPSIVSSSHWAEQTNPEPGPMHQAVSETFTLHLFTVINILAPPGCFSKNSNKSQELQLPQGSPSCSSPCPLQSEPQPWTAARIKFNETCCSVNYPHASTLLPCWGVAAICVARAILFRIELINQINHALCLCTITSHCLLSGHFRACKHIPKAAAFDMALHIKDTNILLVYVTEKVLKKFH